MSHLSNLGMQVLESKAAQKKEVGSSFFKTVISDPMAIAGLGFEQMGDAEATQRMDSLFEATRKIQWANHGHLQHFKVGASDAEVQEEVKRFDAKKVRMDAGEGTFLQRDLEFLDPQVYENLYQDKTQWERLFPQRELSAPGMDTYRYQMTDFTGEADFGSDGANDTPMVNNKGEWYTKLVHKLHLGYNYTIDELRAHIFGNRPLETQRIDAVIKGYQQKMHKIIWDGDAAHDIDGVLNHPNVTNVVAPTRETSLITWAAKVAGTAGGMNVVRDLIDFVKAANIASQNRFWNAENPGIIAVPLDQFHLISAETLDTSNASNISIKDYAIKSIVGLSDIVGVIDLDGKGTGATDLAFGWVPQGNLMEIVTTMPMTWQPMERRGQLFQFYSDKKIIGPVVRYSDSMYQMYGI
jgi:hypothetical protein